MGMSVVDGRLVCAPPKIFPVFVAMEFTILEAPLVCHSSPILFHQERHTDSHERINNNNNNKTNGVYETKNTAGER